MAVKQEFSSFEDMLAGADKPTLVDFYATWCGPCQLMAGELKKVKDKLQDQLQIVKIDTDRYEALASKHQIHALPTMVLFKDGQEIDRIEGAMTASQLVDRLQPNLLAAGQTVGHPPSVMIESPQNGGVTESIKNYQTVWKRHLLLP